MYLLVGFLLAAVLLLFGYNSYRKKAARQRLGMMSQEDKCRLFNQILEPLGYCYEESCDIISTTVDAWQRKYGYTKAFDRYAPYLGMVFDCEPVYFDFEGKTWLIEFWKGQYGINTGCEIGVYRADHIIPEEKRETVIFSSAADEEMMDMSVYLYRNGRLLADLRKRHWWLTIFDMGIFSEPQELSIKISITFPGMHMLQTFLHAMEKRGYRLCDICICGRTVFFAYDSSQKTEAVPGQFFIWLVQEINYLNCRLYRWVTRPFHSTLDRMLFLYFYFSAAFRIILQWGRYGKRQCRLYEKLQGIGRKRR